MKLCNSRLAFGMCHSWDVFPPQHSLIKALASLSVQCFTNVCFFSSFFIIARAGVSLMLCQSKVPGVPGEYVPGARSSEKALRTDF